MESRKRFVQQVKKKIISEHGKGEESFILGLSGRWGEGKTTFLKDLQKALPDSYFCIWISPWKFGTDELSFLRDFLRQVSNLTKRDACTRFCDFLNDNNEIDNLRFDTSRNQPKWGLITVLCVVILLFSILYWIVRPLLEYGSFKEIELIKKSVLTFFLILTPIAGAILQSLVTNQQSSKAISTIDEFGNLLGKYLLLLKEDRKKLIVFIDDLDRVTPEVARRTLDAMRVFFNEPEISFIVAGDHTVLEEYIGHQIKPKVDLSEQREEGRRYLKKIFNLYWGLPLPIDVEFNVHLTTYLGSHEKELSKIFKDPLDLAKFHSYLHKYFEKNLRRVVRFVDTVIFTFEIIADQHENAEVKNQKYFMEMQDKPLLVVRTLMIQELCMPLFERVLEHSDVLKQIEWAIDKKETDRVNEILQEITMTGNQTTFIRRFLNEEDRFYKDKVLLVQALDPYLFLSADATFGDARGLSKEDFIEELNLGDPKSISDKLHRSGQSSIQDAAAASRDLILRASTPEVKGQIIHNLSAAMSLIGDDPIQGTFIEAIQDIDYSDVFGVTNVPKRLEVSLSVWAWMDTQDNKAITDLLKQFPYIVADDFNSLVLPEGGFGKFSSQIISSWLAHYYSVDPSPALEQMERIFPHLDKEAIKANSDVTIAALIHDMLVAVDIARKNRIYYILCEYFPDCKIRLKDGITSSIASVDDEMWNWATGKVDDDYHTWNRQDLENAIIEAVVNSTTVQEFTTRLVYAQQKLTSHSSDQMWIRLNLEKPNLLDESFPNLIGSPIPQLRPPSKIAKAIFDRYLVLVKDDTNRLTSSLLYFKKDVWLWVQLNHLPYKKDFEKMLGSENQEIVDRSREVLTSWEGVNKEAEA